MTSPETLQRLALWLTLSLTFPYLIALALIAFWPTPVDADARGALEAVIAWLHNHGAPGSVRYGAVEFGANIALFVPVGFFVSILAGARRWWLGMCLGATASCLIELGQFVFLPHRFATVEDVLANTTGTIVGTIGALIVLRWLLSPRAKRGEAQ